MPVRKLLLFFIIGLIPSLSIAGNFIDRIRVVGNEKTNSSVIRGLSELRENQEYTGEMLSTARDRVASSGLFEKVRVFTKKSYDEGNRKYDIITISVKEKMSWFVAPVLKFAEDALAGGVVAGESNLFGLNKKALVFADYGPSNRRFVLAYRDPSVAGSDFTLAADSIIRWDRMIEYENREEIRRVRLLEYGGTIVPGYSWSPRFTSGIGAYYRRIDENLRSQSKPLERVGLKDKSNDIAIVVRFEYDASKNYDGLFHGAVLKFESTLSDNRFKSDFDYSKQELRFDGGLAFWKRQYAWKTNASVQLGQSLPYYREYMSGGSNLRGYVERQFRGDTKYTHGHQFFYPIHNFDRFIIRGVFFWDTTVLYFKDQKFSREAWNNGVGGGIRLYLKGIVIPLLGFDAAWGIEDKEHATYLNVGATF